MVELQDMAFEAVPRSRGGTPLSPQLPAGNVRERERGDKFGDKSGLVGCRKHFEIADAGACEGRSFDFIAFGGIVLEMTGTLIFDGGKRRAKAVDNEQIDALAVDGEISGAGIARQDLSKRDLRKDGHFLVRMGLEGFLDPRIEVEFCGAHDLAFVKARVFDRLDLLVCNVVSIREAGVALKQPCGSAVRPGKAICENQLCGGADPN